MSVYGYHDRRPEFRLVTDGKQEDLRRDGLDWRKYALQESNVPPKVLEIAELLARYDSDQVRVAHYSGSRRDYYNWKPGAAAYLRRHAAGQLSGIVDPGSGHN